METATKCMLCDISLECSLTRNVRDLCEGQHKDSYDQVELSKSNLHNRLRVIFQEMKFNLRT
jgi:hypothetical protein